MRYLILLLVSVGLLVWNLSLPTLATYSKDSSKIEKVFEDYFKEFLKLNPEKASEIGLSKESGYYFNQAGLNDLSGSGIEANYRLARKYLNRIKQIDTSELTTSQKIDAQILSWFLEVQLEGERYRYHNYYIDHLFGVHSQLINLMTGYHSIDHLQDAYDYIKRLEKIPVKLKQVEEQVDIQGKKRIWSPVFIINRVITFIDDFKNKKPEENLLYTDFRKKLTSLKNVDSNTVEKLCNRVELTIKEKIYPAYNKLHKRLEVSAQKADSLAGVWKLPEGEGYYQYCLKYFTTTSLKPEQVYLLGLKEVESLQEKARSLLDSLGIKGDKTYGQLIRDYRATWGSPDNQDKFFYPDTQDRRQNILRDYQSLIDSALIWLPEAFSYLPKTEVTVQAVPAYREASGLTYYEPASCDGKRKAVFYINLAQPFPKPKMRSLTYHETVPGHHYQIALQQDLTQNRMFKNLFFLIGFAEGWAMYVEELAFELGKLPDINSRIAEWNSQLFRAVRVVVDVGIHYKKWSKEQAKEYMEDNLGWSSDNEIDRYIVWPGQACSYTIGKLKIKELRNKAMKELRSKFSLKDFHMTVLKNGSLPLEMLEVIIDDYINGSR